MVENIILMIIGAGLFYAGCKYGYYKRKQVFEELNEWLRTFKKGGRP